MAYDPYLTDPYNDEEQLRQLNGTNTPPPPTTGGNTGIAPVTPPPTGGYDLEAFRKAWAYGGNGFGTTTSRGELDQFLKDRQDITAGVTLKNEKAYDPQGRFIADLIGDVDGKNSRIFLDGVGSNGKPRTTTPPKSPPGVITPPGPGNLPTGGVSGGAGGGLAPAVPGVGGSVAPIQDPRIAALYETLLGRSKQGLDVGRDDPAVRGQADAFSAQQTRSQRDYIADLAEKAGPTANLRGEQRLASERSGQASGAFEADLMAREMTAKRDEIKDALSSMQGLLTTEQTLALQKELAVMDDAVKRLTLKQQESQFGRNLDQQKKEFADTMKFRYADLSQQQKQFMLDLGYKWSGRQWEMDPGNPANRL